MDNQELTDNEICLARRALEFGIHYGFNTPNFEPETCDEAWVEFMEREQNVEYKKEE